VRGLQITARAMARPNFPKIHILVYKVGTFHQVFSSNCILGIPRYSALHLAPFRYSALAV